MSFALDHLNYHNAKIAPSLQQAVRDIKAITANAADINITQARISGVGCCIVSAEGLASSQLLAESVFQPVMELSPKASGGPRELFKKISQESLLAADTKAAATYGELLHYVFSGFAAVIVDGVPKAAVYGVQGFEKRAVSVPESEQTVSAAQDSFVEAVRTDISLIRRRMKTPSLRFEMIPVGSLTLTDVCLMYIEGRADPRAVDKIRRSLNSVKTDTVLTGERIQPYIDESYRRSIFPSVINTERPDAACLYLSEGRVCLLVDGTPFCIVIPTTFGDNFRTMDDLCRKGFYSKCLVLLRYTAFVLAVVFPGLYVALVMFHPEIFSLKLLLNLAAAEEATPYPLPVEMTLLMILFEIMREAGVRLPKAVGGAVSIVGGLIIGDAAVKSGMVSQPLLIVVGITATASFVLPGLYPTVSVLRLVFILAGGTAGLLGITIAAAAVTTNINAMNDLSVDFTRSLTKQTGREVLAAEKA